MKIILFLLILSFAKIDIIYAQSTDIAKPNVILFKLSESSTQISAHEYRGDSALANELRNMDYEAHKSIIQDFKNNFSYCPIYFFKDSDFEFIKSKQWTNATFYDTSYNETKKSVLLNNPGNYFIAEINYPPSIKYDTIGNEASTRSNMLGEDDGTVASHDYCLLLSDENNNLLPRKLGVTNIFYRKVGNIFKGADRKYRFIGAAKLEQKLRSAFGY